MSHAATIPTPTLGPARGRLIRAALVTAAIGLAAALVHAAVADHGLKRLALAYLVSVAFVLSLSLGALFFIIIQHLSRAGWSVLCRRIAEAMAANILVAALLCAPVLATVAAGSTLIYPWSVWHVGHDGGHDTHGSSDAHEAPHVAAADEHQDLGYPHHHLDDLTLRKRAWLNPAFFLLRWVIYLGAWSWLATRFWRWSRRQDEQDDYAPTQRCQSLSAPAALIFAVTVTLAANDLLASLNPHWYSSIFGVYYFSGAAVGAMALLIAAVAVLERMGRLAGTVGVEHTHDLGKFLFAFVFFWAYVAYSQYMLLWYAHIPETVGWLVHRGASTAQPNGWSVVLVILALGHFAVPFAVLMSRHVKRRTVWLAASAAWLLVMHWLDLVWLVMPELGPDLAMGAMELGLLAAVGGVYVAGLAHLLGKAPLIPVNDPRLHESLAFENI